MTILVGPNIGTLSSSTGLIYHFDPGSSKSYTYNSNLYPYSEVTTATAWVNSPTNHIILSTTSTGGPYNGAFITAQCTTSTGGAYFFEWGNLISLTAGDIVTQTWHVKPASSTTNTISSVQLRYWSGTGRAWAGYNVANFDLSSRSVSSFSGPTTTGTAFTTASISVLDNGWFRLSYTAMAEATGYSAMSLTNPSPAVNQVFSFGAMQIEKNRTFTKYTPTYGTAITKSPRAYDLSGTNTSSFVYGNLSFSSSNGGVIDATTTTSGYINTPVVGGTMFSSSSTFSIGAWFKITDAVSQTYNVAVGTIVGCFNYDGYGLGWRTSSVASSMYVEGYMRTRGGGPQSGGQAVSYLATVNTWNYYVFTYDWLNLKGTLYVNGNSYSSFDISPLASTGTFSLINSQNFSIASSYASGGPPGLNLPGQLGPVSIYNRALTSDEIKQNFSAYRGRYGI